jgi:hypothetical protein
VMDAIAAARASRAPHDSLRLGAKGCITIYEALR